MCGAHTHTHTYTNEYVPGFWSTGVVRYGRSVAVFGTVFWRQ